MTAKNREAETAYYWIIYYCTFNVQYISVHYTVQYSVFIVCAIYIILRHTFIYFIV